MLVWFVVCRTVEVGGAFLRDAMDHISNVSPTSNLNWIDRLHLALATYCEIVLDFAILYVIVPLPWWRDGSKPNNMSDAIYFSATTITTSGNGAMIPGRWPLQMASVAELQ